jgi:hypothetical protein
MPMSTERALRRLRHLDDMPYGAARARAALELVDTIRAEGPPGCLAYAFIQLIDAYYFGDQTERAYVPFTELVGWLDQHPEHFDQADVHNSCWAFKLMVGALPSFPSITRPQVEQAIDDLERHFRQAGFGLDVAAQCRFEWSDHVGAADADSRLRTWMATPREELSNCELCVPIDRAGFLARSGQLDEAIEMLEHTFATVDVGAFPHCRRQPFGGYVLLSHLYLDRGRPDDPALGVDFHCRALGHIAERGSRPDAIGGCIEFAARARQGEHALRLLETYGPRGLRADLPRQRMLFLAALAAATQTLTTPLGLGHHPIALPAVPVTTVAELAAWAEAEALTLAGQFDQRNGNAQWTERIGQSVVGRVWQEPLDVALVSRALRATAVGPEATTAAAALGAESPDHATSTPDPAAPTATASSAGPRPTASEDLLALPPEELFDRAERAPAGTSPATRATWYLAAARGFEAAGTLPAAGFAWAEAGMLAHVLDDRPAAVTALGRGAQILRGLGDIPLEVRGPVQREFALAAARAGDHAAATRAVDELAADLANLAADHPARASLRVAVDLTRATILDAAGQSRAAADLARGAAEQAVAQQDITTAVQAFLVGGTALVTAGDDAAALWYFESACEGADALRQPSLRAEMAEHYVAALRRLGRAAEADAYLDRW